MLKMEEHLLTDVGRGVNLIYILHLKQLDNVSLEVDCYTSYIKY
jgi:hypothetical protein